MKRIGLFTTIAAVAVFCFSSCGHSPGERLTQLEEQRREWEAQMDETFPENTRDTVELRRRLEYFRANGNLVGQRTNLRALGYSARNNSLYGQAIEYHAEALALAYEVVDTVPITNLLNELGTDFRRTGAHEEAIKYHYQALEMAEHYHGSDTAMVTRNMAAAYNGIGIVYSAMKEQDEAIRAHENALRIEIGKKNYTGMAMNYSNIGIILLERGDYPGAMEYFELSLASNQRINSVVGIGLCNFNIGTVYSRQGDYEKALAQYLKVYETLESLDKSHWVRAALSIGETYMALGDYRRAQSYLDEGLDIATEIDFPAYIRQAHALLSDYWFAVGEYRRSREELSRSVAWADTVRNNLETSRFMEPRIQYETGRFTRQIAQMNEAARVQAARQRTTILMALPFILALIFLSIFLYARRKQSQRKAAEMKELERMRSNFFTNITHELRTPITVINGLSEHLVGGPGTDSAAQKKDLDAIRQQGENLMHLVNQLLEFSRSEAGVDRPKWRRGDMVEYLKILTEPYARFAQSRGVGLVVYSETESLSMNFAPSSLKKVMANLLSNAIRHCSEGDDIVVHFRYDEAARRCFIRMKDSGEGIAPENLPRIFELYYTSASARAGEMGSGIGLALSRQLVEEMGGVIGVESTPGKGAEFTVSLPVSTAEIPAHEREEFPEEAPTAIPDPGPEDRPDDRTIPDPARSHGKKTVLVIEDSRDVAHYISTILQGRYSMLYASNGNEGLMMAERHIPDVIITDVMMPGKDGYAFTRELRASVAVSHIPVIMVTARVTTEDKLEGLKAGVDAYLPKPFDERELLARIKQLLDSRAMLMEVYSDALFRSDRSSQTMAPDHNMAFITKLSVAVNAHLADEGWFPGGLCAEMCLSESQLGRKLKAMTGHTISSFVMRARLNKAKQLLSRRDRSIKEVAFACGFSDLSYFSRSFRKVFGYTPSEFLKIPESPPARID